MTRTITDPTTCPSWCIENHDEIDRTHYGVSRSLPLDDLTGEGPSFVAVMVKRDVGDHYERLGPYAVVDVAPNYMRGVENSIAINAVQLRALAALLVRAADEIEAVT